MDSVVLSELCVPLLAGCFIGSRAAYGVRQVGLVALVAIPLSLLVSTARLADRANVGQWYGPGSWTKMYFLGLGLSAIIIGLVLAAAIALIAAAYQTKKGGR